MEPHMISLINSLTPITGGWHVKDLDNGKCVDVLEMAYNYRLLLSSRDHMTYDHGWCFFGFGVDANGNPRTMDLALLAAVAAALIWDGTGSPQGYDKQAC